MTDHQLIFVNLPVADLARSRAFFTHVGYALEESFCDGDALCVRLGPTIFAMLLREEFFARFHDGPPAPPGSVGSMLCLSAATREEVDALADRALLGGGRHVRTQDLGFMYGRSYSDPDGHVWEILWTDPRATIGGPGSVVGETVEVGPGTAGA